MADTGKTLNRAHPGVLQVGSERHVLVRPELLSEIQKGVEDRLGIKSAEYLYAAGSFWATHEAKRIRSSPEEDPEQLAKKFCKHAGDLGWGEWHLESFRQEERGLMIRVDRSPLAEAYGQSDEPVCHLLAGAIAGLVEVLFRIPATCTELACKVQGADACQFSAVCTDLAAGEAWEW